MTSFHHCVKLLLQRSMLSTSEALIQISQSGYRSEPPIPSCSFSRLGRQQSRCPRRLCSCQHVSVFEISAVLWAFSPDTELHVSTGKSRFLKARSSSRRFAVSARSNLCFAVSAKSNLLIPVFLENNIFNVYLNREVKSTETNNVNDADHCLTKNCEQSGYGDGRAVRS